MKKPTYPAGRLSSRARRSCRILPAFAAILAALVSRSSAATITLNATVNISPTYTILGTTENRTILLPRFDPALGSLSSITIGYRNDYLIDAVSKAETGIHIPPSWIASWSWDVRVFFGWSGPGFSLSLGEILSADQPVTSNVFPLTAHVQTPVRTLTSAVVKLDPGDTGFSSYVGSGSVSTQFQAGHSTTIFPLPATAAGFTWLPTNNITAAGIAQVSSSLLVVEYEFTPVPETSPVAPAILLSALAAGRRRRG